MRSVSFVRVEGSRRGQVRVEHGEAHSRDSVYFARLLGGQGLVPLPRLAPRSSWAVHDDLDRTFTGFVGAVEAVLRGDPLQGSAQASALVVDLARGRGHAIGALGVYSFRGGAVDIPYDASFGAQLPPSARDSPELPVTMPVCSISPRGVEGDAVPTAFSFEGADALLVSSEPLHWTLAWPLASPSQVVAAAIDAGWPRGLVFAIWQSVQGNA